jgi:hypothetical protein
MSLTSPRLMTLIAFFSPVSVLMAKRTMLLAPLPSFRFSSYLPILRLRCVDPKDGEQGKSRHTRARE